MRATRPTWRSTRSTFVAWLRRRPRLREVARTKETRETMRAPFRNIPQLCGRGWYLLRGRPCLSRSGLAVAPAPARVVAAIPPAEAEPVVPAGPEERAEEAEEAVPAARLEPARAERAAHRAPVREAKEVHPAPLEIRAERAGRPRRRTTTRTTTTPTIPTTNRAASCRSFRTRLA